MKQLVIIILVIAITGGVIYILNNSSAPEDLERASVSDSIKNQEQMEREDSSGGNPFNMDEPSESVELVEFKFTGYGPGKTETGTFEDIQIDNSKLTIKTASVSTGKDGLDKHLCSGDFFDCATYPEITFEPTSISMQDSTGTITGNLDFRGITKEVSFNVKKENDLWTANFAIDVTPFNFKYTAIDDEVEIQVSARIK